MKIFFLSLFICCTLLCGCSETIRDGPPVINSVELNTDSLLNGSMPGTYKVYIRSIKGSNPVFYSYIPYKSGESLVPISSLQSMIDKKTGGYLDTIASKNRMIDKLEKEKEIIQQQLNEKNILIRFLTGK